MFFFRLSHLLDDIFCVRDCLRRPKVPADRQQTVTATKKNKTGFGISSLPFFFSCDHINIDPYLNVA